MITAIKIVGKYTGTPVLIFTKNEVINNLNNEKECLEAIEKGLIPNLQIVIEED